MKTLIVLMILLIATPAFAQKDTMKVNERLNAVVIPKQVEQKNIETKKELPEKAEPQLKIEKKEKSK